MRNEGAFIVEWVSWYRMLGFTDIVVVTNDCTDHSPDLLDAMAQERWMHHLRCDGIPPGQGITPRKLAMAAQSRPVRRAGWVFVCDVDEFLVVHRGDGTIHDLLPTGGAPPPFLGMSVNWRIFGTCGVDAYEDVPVHRQFSLALPLSKGLSKGIKTLYREPGWFAHMGEHGPRRLNLALAGKAWGDPGMAWVNAAGEEVSSWTPRAPYVRRLPQGEATHEGAQINHYMLRSAESFSLKYNTLSPVALQNRYTRGYFRRANAGEEPDMTAFRYADRFDAMRAKVMAIPGVARLHALCCADHLRLIHARAGTDAAADPRIAAFEAQAAAASAVPRGAAAS